MSTTPRPGPPAGMPAHLWELAKRDVRGLLPERLREAPDAASSAPRAVRAVARRVASLAAVLGAAGVIREVADDPEVALAATATPTGPPVEGELDPAPTVPGGGDHGQPFGHVGSHTEGGGGHVDAGLGSTWHVTADDGSGHPSVMTVQLFQDVVVVENADGTFTVVAEQVVRIVDPQGHEHVFHEHYETTVPDPPGQETDLIVHEDGHVRLVENPDGSFTPSVDTSITITAGADGDGHDEVSIDQDESVSIHDHDPHHGDVVRTDLSETASSTSHDTGDEATSTIHQDETVGEGGRRADSPSSTPPATTAPAAASSTAASSTAASSTAASSSAVVGTVAPDVVRLDPVPDGRPTWALLDREPTPDHDADAPAVASVAPGHPDPAFTGGHGAPSAPGGPGLPDDIADGLPALTPHDAAGDGPDELPNRPDHDETPDHEHPGVDHSGTHHAGTHDTGTDDTGPHETGTHDPHGVLDPAALG